MEKIQTWPTLFKAGKSGKMMSWEIQVKGNTIITHAGFVDGTKKESKDTLKSGKNIGRANATTPHEQAVAEAQSKFQKQLDRGYTHEKSGKSTDTSEVFFPMLAHEFEKRKKHVEYPCFVQPKLDGLRATYIKGKGFFSRGKKPFPAVAHLMREIEILEQDCSYPIDSLDGELYIHDKNIFEEIVGAVKRNSSAHPLLKKLEYHVYDTNLGVKFCNRWAHLKGIRDANCSTKIKFVETRVVSTEEEIREAHDEYVANGYEGVMVRSMFGPYEAGTRSNNLLKLKSFLDDEFEIVDALEGRGRLSGHVGKFVCRISDKRGERTFEAVLSGRNIQPFLKKCFTDESLWKGKLLQVKYQGLTGANHVPRFPVGLRIREAE